MRLVGLMVIKVMLCGGALGDDALSSSDYFSAASHIGHQGRAQGVLGPMQDDEALLLFALVQASHVRRTLEIGALGGFSALTVAQVRFNVDALCVLPYLRS